MGRLSDWLRRKVRDPLMAELRQGAAPESVAAAVSVSLAIAINPIIGTTTVGCVIAGRLFRLNHVVMQIINHVSYPIQILLIVPFVRLGETVTGSQHLHLTPQAIIDKVNAAMNKTLAVPELQKKLEDGGAIVMPGTPKEFEAFYLKDYARWGEVIKKAGISTKQ